MHTPDIAYPDFYLLDAALGGFFSEHLFWDTICPVMDLKAGKGVEVLEQFTPSVLRFIRHGKDAERAAAAFVLGWIRRTDENIDALLDSLNDPAKEVANAAACALWKLGIPAEAYYPHVLSLEASNKEDDFQIKYRRAKAGIIRIGRASEMDLPLTKDKRVSREHFQIDFRPPRVYIVDRGSTNGTYLKNVRIAESVICSGDTITVGSTHVVMRILSRQTKFVYEHSPTIAFSGESVKSIRPGADRVEDLANVTMVETTHHVAEHEIVLHSLQGRKLNLRQRIHLRFIAQVCASQDPSELTQNQLLSRVTSLAAAVKENGEFTSKREAEAVAEIARESYQSLQADLKILKKVWGIVLFKKPKGETKNVTCLTEEGYTKLRVLWEEFNPPNAIIVDKSKPK